MGEKTSKYLQQLKAILIRNILLKKREKRKTLAEILVPCTLLALMIVIKLAAPTPHYPAITVLREDTKLADYFHQNISIAVVPNTTGVQMFLNKSNELLEEMMKHDIHHQPIEFVFYESEDALLKVYWTTPSSIQLAVIFDNDDPCSKELSYGIRTNPSLKVPSTQDHLSSKISCRLKTSHWKGMFPLEAGDTCPVNQYFHSGFIGMQALLDYTKMRTFQAVSEGGNKRKKRNLAYPVLCLCQIAVGSMQKQNACPKFHFIPHGLSLDEKIVRCPYQ